MSLILTLLYDFALDVQNIIVTGATDLVRLTPTLVMAGFGVLGFIGLLNQFWSFFRMIGSLYLTKGQNVSGRVRPREHTPLTVYCSSDTMARKVAGCW